MGGPQPAARYVPHAQRCCPEPSIVHPWRAGWADGWLDAPRSFCLPPAFAPSQPSIHSLAGARGGRSPWTAGPHGLRPLWLEAADGRVARLPGPGRRASARGSSSSRQTSWCPRRCSRTLGAKGGAFAVAPDRWAMALAAWPTRLGPLHPPLGLGAPASRLPWGSLTDRSPSTRAGSLPPEQGSRRELTRGKVEAITLWEGPDHPAPPASISHPASASHVRAA